MCPNLVVRLVGWRGHVTAARHEVFQALGDPTLLAIVERLGQACPMSRVPLLESLGMTRQAATKHLLTLESV